MQLLSDLDVTACIFKEKVFIKTFNIFLESTQNKQQFNSKISYTQERKKSYGAYNVDNILGFSPPVPP